MPFLAESTILGIKTKPESLVAKCSLCKLYKHCKSPKMPVYGKGRKGILIVGEAPGETEDEKGRPFAGKSGRFLEEQLRAVDIDMTNDCWRTNAIICFPGNTQIESPSPIKKVYRRKYHGDLITIKTRSGRNLTGTPNHPILTTSGWIPLSFLKEGDNLICRVLSQGSILGNSNKNDPPTPIQKVFDSLSISGIVSRVIGSSNDFHGDGVESNVDIVVSNSKLGSSAKAHLSQHRNQSSLKLSNHGLISLEAYRSQNSVATVSTSLSGFMGSGSQFQSLPGRQPTHSCSHCFTSVSDGDSFVNENSFEFSLPDTEFFGEEFNPFPFEVSLDSIIQIEFETFDDFFNRNRGAFGSSHDNNLVYNLETEHGYYIANGIVVSNCHPAKNRTPTTEEIEYCRPNLTKAIKELQPAVILTVGLPALQSVIMHSWTDSIGPMGRWVGWAIPSRDYNAWICPTWHPSYIQREISQAKGGTAIPTIFMRHLEQVARKASRGRPYKKVPNLDDKIMIVSANDAIRILWEFANLGPAFSFDYETNMLKPDDPKAKIYAISICGEYKAISFPFQGEALMEAWRALMKSRIGKIAQNLKFEDRWTHRICGVEVRNWVWDTMIQAHVIDPRPGICSLSFQAFVNFGVGTYCEHISPLMGPKNAKDSYGLNRIKEIDLKDLLVYNGKDAYLTMQLAKKQMKKLKVKL